MKTEHWLKSEGRLLRLSNLEKVIYPETGFTKRDVLRYYQRIAPAMLPHLRARPITLKRFPEGVEGGHFFEKRCPSSHPNWIRTFVYLGIEYCRIDSLPALLWAANLGSIELHPILSAEKDHGNAGEMVFDLDPGSGAGLRECARVAVELARLLDELSLRSFAKASGSKGIQVYVPLHSRTSFEQTKDFSRTIARKLERRDPCAVTATMALRERAGKVYVDWAQNDANKTTVCVYSLRATRYPSVSYPLKWEEVRAWASEKESGGAPSFPPDRAVTRFEREGDLFAPVLGLVQRLPRSSRVSIPA